MPERTWTDVEASYLAALEQLVIAVSDANAYAMEMGNEVTIPAVWWEDVQRVLSVVKEINRES